MLVVNVTGDALVGANHFDTRSCASTVDRGRGVDSQHWGGHFGGSLGNEGGSRTFRFVHDIDNIERKPCRFVPPPTSSRRFLADVSYYFPSRAHISDVPMQRLAPIHRPSCHYQLSDASHVAHDDRGRHRFLEKKRG